MFVPRLPWNQRYSKTDLKDDWFAGLTTAVMLVPQAMAYALLAGLPPQVGLYASTVPIFVYAFLGSSRSLAVGPVAMDSILSAAAVGAVALTHPGLTEEDKIVAAALLAFMVGLVLVLMGAFKLGRLVSLFTPTIISAFTSAAALIIGINQLKLILGIELERSSQVFVILRDLMGKINTIHLPTLTIGLFAIVSLIAMKKYAPKLPRAFIVVLVGALAVVLGGMGEQGVKLVGGVPNGLPSLQTPWMNWGIVQDLIPHALVIALVAFMESISISTKLKRAEDNLDPSRELVALGTANLASGLFQGYSVTGGLSRSAVNDSAGAKSQVSALITGVIVVLVLSFFTGALVNIPKAVLGAIIMTAVFGLMSIQDAKDVFTKQKHQIPVYVVTFLVTLLVGIKEGLLIGALTNWIFGKVWNTENTEDLTEVTEEKPA